MHENIDIQEDVKLHLRESALLQKQWFTYVFEAVEKLNVKVEETTLQVQKEREEFFRALVEQKEKLSAQISVASKDQATELKELEKKLLEFIETVRARFSKISTDVGHTIDEKAQESSKGLTTVEHDLRNAIESVVKTQEKINEKFDTGMDTLKTGHTVMKTKLAIYVAFISLSTSVVMGVFATTLVFFFRDAIKAWLG